MDSEGTPLTEWIPLEQLPAEGEKGRIHIYISTWVQQGKTYKVNMKAIDNAGNEATKYEENEENPEQIVEIEELEDSTTKVVPSIAPTDATQGPVNVTFTNNSTKEGNIKISNKWPRRRWLVRIYRKSTNDSKWKCIRKTI